MSCSYSAHSTKRLRLMGEEGWAEMDPGYSYKGQKLIISRKHDANADALEQRVFAAKNQFATQMDDLASLPSTSQLIRIGR